MTKRILAILIAFLYSIVCAILGPTIQNQIFEFGIRQILMFIIYFVVSFGLNLLILHGVSNWNLDIRNNRISKLYNELSERKIFLIIWAFIFLPWIPAYLILYPGVLSYDMISQTSSAMGTITDNHHPILHTWLIRIFMKLGAGAFGGYEYGLGILSLLQMILLSYALARLVCLLKKKGVPSLLVILTALGSALWFMNAVLSVTMIKDTLHAAFLVLFVCHFAEIVLNPSEYVKCKRNIIALPFISFFMCAFRNNGYHIYLFCFAGLLMLRIANIKQVKKYILLIVAIILPICMFKIYSGPVFEALNIEQGQVREALSVPIQQLQRVAVTKADVLTEEQTYGMDYYIDNLAWRSYSPYREYNPFFADPAKGCFYSGRYEEAPIAFWKFYLQIGKQFTTEYVKAFLCNTLGYWYPGYYEYSYVMYDNYEPEVFAVSLERKGIGETSFLAKCYESLCGSNFWRETPVVRVFFVSGVAPWILLYSLLLAWKKKEFLTKSLPLFLPLIAQYGIMILSPMSSFRYSWPFFLMLPIVCIGIWGGTQNEMD